MEPRSSGKVQARPGKSGPGCSLPAAAHFNFGGG